jgi:hypothetical protein
VDFNLEACNRCCSHKGQLQNDIVVCSHCGFSEPIEIWQILGWRLIVKYPPTHKGTIFVYGKNIGRTVAHWDEFICDNTEATHWLRTPDPRKQINM